MKCKHHWFYCVVALVLAGLSPLTFAAAGSLDLTRTGTGYFALLLFAIGYVLVMLEEVIHMRKSKPVLVAAGIIWIAAGIVYSGAGLSHEAASAFRHTLLDFAELFLFLLVAMAYMNAMEERNVFEGLRIWLLRKGFSYKTLFWITGILAFFISSFVNNLTTAMLMCAVVLKVGNGDKRFINLCCINVVVAVNAGGVFTPFGDITSLMVWQAGKVTFQEFFYLMVPAFINFGIPAVIMSFFVENRTPAPALNEVVNLKRGARRIIALFMLTTAGAVVCFNGLDLPPVLGMMMGLGLLQFFGYFLRMTLPRSLEKKRAIAEAKGDEEALKQLGAVVPFDVFGKIAIARAEWDTLLFFYGIVMCVGGLGFMGYLGLMSHALYDQLGNSTSNIVLGLVSAFVDNIPVMFAAISMNPDMPLGDWLLVALTTGTGGSMLSIGSASGVALMGQARGYYTFISHLKWMPAIALGYAASVAAHMWINSSLF
jgi:Na+/H+ antiporter NhaD/arsenite permease-like protein